jgi:hypothetical protein
MKALKALVTALALLLTVTRTKADITCEWFGYCIYESPGFKIRIVDQDSGQPVAGVHALAGWIQYGSHGTGGPLMALDAISGADGVLSFPAWGPIKGSSAGIEIALAPGISLFKPGYKHLLLNNVSSRDHRARVRGFTQDGQTFKMETFRGDAKEWVQELNNAAYPKLMTRVSEHFPEKVRSVYIKRWQLIRIETEKLSKDRQDVSLLLDNLNREIRALSVGGSQ